MKRKPGRPRTMSDILSSKKSCMDNLDASTTQLPSQAPILQPPPPPPPRQLWPPSQQLQPPSRRIQPPLQDTHVIRKRKVSHPTSQPQQQQASTRDTTNHAHSHPSSSTPAEANTISNSHDTGLRTSKKRGRGKALGIKGWGTSIKLKVQFDGDYSPLGAKGKSLVGQLGVMVRNSYRVPLTFLDWQSVPDNIKEDIWKEVKDNLEDCPDEFKSVCMDNCRRIYKDNKGKIKDKHYKPYMVPNPDPNIASRCPDFIDPDQWRQLVEYWADGDVMAEALRNSENRSDRGPLQNTGRTPFSHIRHELAANGESLDKMSVYLKTRRKDDPDVKEILAVYNQQVELLSEDERTVEARDRIFHSIVGEDDHGYCRTYGGGVHHSSVYKKDPRPSQINNPLPMAEMEQRVVAHLTEQFTIRFEQLKSQMFENMESRGSEARQFPDAASGHRTVRESIGDGDGTSPFKQTHGTPAFSPIPDLQFTREVYLQTSCIPKFDVGEGLLITSDPAIEIDGERLGEGYCQVYVGKAIMPRVRLERPRQGVETVGDALGHYVAWRFCDVIEKEMDDY